MAQGLFDPVLDGLDTLLAWISSGTKATIDANCEIQTADSPTVLVTNDGSLLSIIRVDGVSKLIGPEEFNSISRELLKTISPFMGSNQYQHLCFGQRADGFAEIYINGVKKDTSGNAWSTSTIVDFQELGRGNNNQHFTGNIALMAGYDKELSQAEILQNNRAFNRKIVA